MGGQLMVTDLHRSSILECDPEAKAIIDEKMKIEGSSVAGIEDGSYDWKSLDSVEEFIGNGDYVLLNFVQN